MAVLSSDLQTILILVPHEDDEINLAGILIDTALSEGRTVHVAFYTDGDRMERAGVRRREAKQSCKVLGITPENVHFLGFHDCPIETREHPFYDKVTHEKSIESISALIQEIHPDLLVVNGLEKHADHRALYRLTIEALERLKDNPQTGTSHQSNGTNSPYPYIPESPRLWVGFCYETGWYGPKDYSPVNQPPTQRLSEGLLAENGIKWEDRICIPAGKNCSTRLLMNNKIYKALKCHGSQWALSKYFSVINSDQVFWEMQPEPQKEPQAGPQPEPQPLSPSPWQKPEPRPLSPSPWPIYGIIDRITWEVDKKINLAKIKMRR